MKKLMLGFAGEIASGKGTATNLVKTLYPGTPSVRFSDSLREFLVRLNCLKLEFNYGTVSVETLVEEFLKDTLGGIFSKEVIERRGDVGLREFSRWLSDEWFTHAGIIKEDRHNLQALSTALRSIFAENILERTVVARIARMKAESPIAIIEGIRRMADIFMLLAEPDFRLIFIEIDPRVAHERMVKRDENVGDREMTFEQFMELRTAEAEQEIRRLKPHAHLVIDNSGKPVVLETTLRKEVEKWRRS